MSICDKCERERECPVSHEDDFCLNYVRKPQTNADRIRAMTDEELAKWLEDHCYQYGWLDWLRQEATPTSIPAEEGE